LEILVQVFGERAFDEGHDGDEIAFSQSTSSNAPFGSGRAGSPWALIRPPLPTRRAEIREKRSTSCRSAAALIVVRVEPKLARHLEGERRCDSW
jgi:hypothetical protein